MKIVQAFPTFNSASWNCWRKYGTFSEIFFHKIDKKSTINVETCHDLLPIKIERDFFQQQKQLITLNYDRVRSKIQY